MICLTFLNLYPYVKLLLPACAESAFAGNKIPAKLVSSCIKSGLVEMQTVANASYYIWCFC